MRRIGLKGAGQRHQTCVAVRTHRTYAKPAGREPAFRPVMIGIAVLALVRRGSARSFGRRKCQLGDVEVRRWSRPILITWSISRHDPDSGYMEPRSGIRKSPGDRDRSCSATPARA